MKIQVEIEIDGNTTSVTGVVSILRHAIFDQNTASIDYLTRNVKNIQLVEMTTQVPRNAAALAEFVVDFVTLYGSYKREELLKEIAPLQMQFFEIAVQHLINTGRLKFDQSTGVYFV